MAMTFTGWCWSVFSPCWSPAKICSGATTVIMPIAMENMTRAPSFACFPAGFAHKRCQAPTAPTTSAVVR